MSRIAPLLLSTWLALTSATAAITASHAADAARYDTSRIVSVGGAVTEILYALGLQKQIVAVDSTSLFPRDVLKEKTNVGYLRQLSPEGVLGLNPTMIIAAEGAGPKETIEVIEQASIPFVHIPDHFSGDGIVEKIRLIATTTGRNATGDCLASQVQRDLDRLSALRRQIGAPARVLFILSFVNGRAMVAGSDTAADGIIKLAGGVNAMAGFRGYKPVSDEAILAAQPDTVLTMQRPDQALTADDVLRHPAFAQTRAARRKSFLSFDGLYLLGFGPRTASAAHDLALALYPTLSKDAPEPPAVSSSCLQ
ncbi:MAG: ABC transporter substrate-binding protein [Rhizobiales bacterium]|nr:ABC transporter substrate-binding protein [Hyphomicrobiales bacterium]OJY46990.1 MAG: hemin ABC transporter substrate-binding protein [Rhizobiales bacterium 64-17]